MHIISLHQRNQHEFPAWIQPRPL